MRNLAPALLLGSVLVAGAVAAPFLYAQSGQEPSGSMMDHRMMGMTGMMKTMQQMGRMMGHCSNMMGENDGRPNERWRKTPSS